MLLRAARRTGWLRLIAAPVQGHAGGQQDNHDAEHREHARDRGLGRMQRGGWIDFDRHVTGMGYQ